MQYRHDAVGAVVEIHPNAMFQKGDIHLAVLLGQPDPFAKIPNGLRRVPASPEP